MPGMRQAGPALVAVLLSGFVHASAAAQEPDPDVVVRADSLRAAYAVVRPPADHGTDWVDVAGFPLKVIGFPFNVLLVRLPAFAIGQLTVPRRPGFLVRALRAANSAGIRPGLRTSIGPKSGLGAGVLVDRFAPVYFNSSISLAGSQRHQAGLRLGTDRIEGRAEFRWQRDARAAFYGVGPRTGEEEVRFRREVVDAGLRGKADFGALAVDLEAAFEDNFVREPLGLGDDESIFERFGPGSLFGTEGRQRYARLGAYVVLDLTRQVEFQRRGGTASAGATAYRGVRNTGSDFHKLFFTLQGHLPLNRRQALALRGHTELTRADSGEVPFYHLAALGGRSSALGFPSGRFTDLDMATLTAEWRYELWRDIHTTSRLEAFLYFGEGAVGRRLGEIAAADWRQSYGLGLRMASTEAFLGLLYLGFSDESSHFGVSAEWQP